MSKLISTVHLFSLSVNRSGDIHMSATRSFFEVLRSKLGAAVGSTLRSGTYDFCEVRKSQFVATPDERGPAAVAEAHKLATHILTIYRSILLFEKVFAKEGSYDLFVLFNQRAPSFRDLQTLAHKDNIYVPFLSLPYKANLQTQPVALATVITESPAVKRLFVVRKTMDTFQVDVPTQKARVMLAVKRPGPTSQQLDALAERFGKSAR